MKITEVLDIIKIFLDVRVEYLEDFEILRNLNTAQFAVVKDQFYNDNMKRSNFSVPSKAFEQSQYNSSDFSPIIEDFTDKEAPLIYLNDKGRLLYEDLQEHFPTTRIFDQNGVIEERKCEVFHIASMMWKHKEKYRKIRWERHNDIAQIENDPHFQATEKYPFYTQNKDYIQVYPEKDKVLRLSVVREPTYMWWDPANANNNQDPELPSSIMYDVIFRALQLSGVQIRENQFIQNIERQEQKQ